MEAAEDAEAAEDDADACRPRASLDLELGLRLDRWGGSSSSSDRRPLAESVRSSVRCLCSNKASASDWSRTGADGAPGSVALLLALGTPKDSISPRPARLYVWSGLDVVGVALVTCFLVCRGVIACSYSKGVDCAWVGAKCVCGVWENNVDNNKPICKRCRGLIVATKRIEGSRCIGDMATLARGRAASTRPATASDVALVMMDTRVPDTLVALASAPTISLKYNVSTLHFAYFLNLKCAHARHTDRLATAKPTAKALPTADKQPLAARATATAAATQK